MDRLTSTDSARDYAAHLLVGELVALRPTTEGDLAVLDAWWHDASHAPLQRGVVLPGPPGSAVEEIRRWSTNDGASADVGFSVEERSTGGLGGHLTLWGSSWWSRSAELSIMMGPDHQGRGLGSDAVRVALRYAFEELGLHRVSLRVWAFNDRALAVYRRAGFTEEGRLREVAFHAGAWHDHVLMSVLEREWRTARVDGPRGVATLP